MKWINCAERLPKPYQKVLAYAPGRMCGNPLFITAEMHEGLERDGSTSYHWVWVNDEDCEFCGFFEDPLFWTELPEIPKALDTKGE